jgi:hypothetical protein
MSNSQNPQERSQGILDNTKVGGDLSARDISQESNTINSNNTFLTLILSGNEIVSSDTEAIISDLSPILDLLNPETIQEAYQNSLPPDAGIWNLESTDIAAILNKLNEFRRLVNFFDQLIQDTSIPEEIRDKLKHYTEKLPPKKPQENKTDKPPNICHQQLESFVLFTLNSTENKDRFLLNAWLIKDNSVEDISKFQSLLSSNEQQQGTLCKLSEIPIKTCNFIKTGLRELRGQRYSLVVEFFLPSSLMLTDVDLWKITLPVVEEITLGTKYPVRLRSLERLDLEYLDFNYNQWCDRWDKVNAVLDDESVFVDFEHLPAMDNFNWKLLKNNLMSKIGLKVTCPPPQSKIEELFRAILTAATPIAIWTRQDLANCDCLTAIDEFLSCKLLSNLCESVRMLREEADADPEEHFGSHLAILWEDPHRLTPDVMAELRSTGQ